MIKKDASYIPPESRRADKDELSYCNPIGTKESPDPFVTFDSVTGYYYLLFTRGRELRVFRSRTLSRLREDESSHQVYHVSAGDGITGSIWAPEMHKIDGRWYIYTSGARTEDGRENRTLFIMRSRTEDPFDGFDLAAFPDPEINAIDPTVTRLDDGSLYMCYAREGRGNRLHIRKMKNPLEFEGEGVLICEAELEWEKVPPYIGDMTIVEGSFFVRSPDNKRTFILYSANGCWSDCYRLGVLELTGDDILSKDSWEKHPDFIFGSGNGTFGPGHASFFKSPSGDQLYIAYHSMHESNVKVSWAPRYLHIQRVHFDPTGFPVIEAPLPMNVPYPEPK